eukprot:TCALIF_11635-PA protein Name:"Protein of unknown function" AED:0.02 eAED:0.02 QI:0/0/0.5/0.5/1/1/2/102/160
MRKKVIMRSIVGSVSLLVIAAVINEAQCQYRRPMATILDDESINREELPSFETLIKPYLEECLTMDDAEANHRGCSIFQITDDGGFTIPPFELFVQKAIDVCKKATGNIAGCTELQSPNGEYVIPSIEEMQKKFLSECKVVDSSGSTSNQSSWCRLFRPE